MENLDEAALTLVRLFERLKIPYVIMGGFAVRIHSLPRPTYDVDFTVLLDRDQLPVLFQAAEQLGFYIPEPYTTGWVDSVRQMPIVKLRWLPGANAIDLDIFLAETPFQRMILDRRQWHTAEGATWQAWFVSVEDLLLLKLMADRPRDRIDVADILLVQGALDETYLRNWAEKLGVADKLETALRERAE